MNTAMLTLHQFARVWDLPNPSPFCCKVETYLRMAEVPYRVATAVPPTAPKRKLPYVVDGSRTIADSRFIIEYVNDRYQVDLDRALTPAERAESLAFERMIEDDLFWIMLWSRWCQPHNWAANKAAIFGGFPPVVRDVGAWFARQKIRRDIWSQGMARHSEEEIFQLGGQDLIALSDFLADKPYFLGDSPTTLDAAAFGFLINVLWCPIESALKVQAESLGNLPSFCTRIRDQYYGDDEG